MAMAGVDMAMARLQRLEVVRPIRKGVDGWGLVEIIVGEVVVSCHHDVVSNRE